MPCRCLSCRGRGRSMVRVTRRRGAICWRTHAGWSLSPTVGGAERRTPSTSCGLKNVRRKKNPAGCVASTSLFTERGGRCPDAVVLRDGVALAAAHARGRVRGCSCSIAPARVPNMLCAQCRRWIRPSMRQSTIAEFGQRYSTCWRSRMREDGSGMRSPRRLAASV